jgi:FSR family fosmidomycin resistance protein-like MFS transporter
VLGVASVTWRRRTLVVAGGVCFAVALALTAGASSSWLLLSAFALLYPASGAFVSLSQSALMDADPAQREHNMARWTLAGAAGVVVGPLLLTALAWAGLGWRYLFAALALAAAGLVALVRRSPDAGVDEQPPRLQQALRAIVRLEVFRWLVLLELADLLLDVFLGFLALYLVDEVGVSRATAGLAIAVWSGAGLLGSAALITLLRRLDGLRYLRGSAVLAAGLLVAFLLVPWVGAKLALVAAIGFVNAGWYPVLQARLYGALAGHSGLVLTVGALFPLNAVLPLGIAAIASRWGLGAALWPLLAAPLALVIFVPRGRP